jgi:hypothetical protein
MDEKGDFIAKSVSLFALQMHIPLILGCKRGLLKREKKTFVLRQAAIDVI